MNTFMTWSQIVVIPLILVGFARILWGKHPEHDWFDELILVSVVVCGVFSLFVSLVLSILEVCGVTP